MDALLPGCSDSAHTGADPAFDQTDLASARVVGNLGTAADWRLQWLFLHFSLKEEKGNICSVIVFLSLCSRSPVTAWFVEFCVEQEILSYFQHGICTEHEQSPTGPTCPSVSASTVQLRVHYEQRCRRILLFCRLVH